MASEALVAEKGADSSPSLRIKDERPRKRNPSSLAACVVALLYLPHDSSSIHVRFIAQVSGCREATFAGLSPRGPEHHP